MVTTEQTTPFAKIFGQADLPIDPITGRVSILAKELMAIPRDMGPYEAAIGVNSRLSEAIDDLSESAGNTAVLEADERSEISRKSSR